MVPNGLRISPLEPTDFEDWLTLSSALFTKIPKEQLETKLRRKEQQDKYQTFMARMDGSSIGFITVTLRTDYVEGTATSPVGYMEAIYVLPEYRKLGVAKALYQKGESWCKDLGCTEMGSDTWYWKKEAHTFHKKLGFNEGDVLVHFNKKIDP